ncbi:hypothetical protein PHYSODRAFT_528766 [Phytophthora sojae]|uniref:DDE-1 domain-containing protein n=1 Tax=Phytophthora sojae (strain P6497) TaxID=1094619 RepID=G5AA88_PHYSP|nr:hypothetical protein PHYSODRAFT_528766 [Phytophthora sojae]EGZ07517.1 hypothetical protein PHYSODRAFT_528766 [Phytophthora sojae]|eukprot:XP_009537083.1 hypothetical protein PHYSODRAFT_528766 [Phytophthora sojae]
MEDTPPPKKKQKSYTVREKREAVRLVEDVGVEEAARDLQLARGTVHGWWKQAEKLFSSKSLKGQGRREVFPDIPAVVTFMKDVRREEKALTTRGIMSFMWAIETEWVEDYLQRKRSGILALERMVERLAIRHDFTSQKPQTAKKSTEELEQTRAEFALDFWKTHAAYGPEGIYNVDETAINFDMPPARMWAGRGRRDAARIANTSKHTGSMTAVLTIQADGKFTFLLFS